MKVDKKPEICGFDFGVNIHLNLYTGLNTLFRNVSEYIKLQQELKVNQLIIKWN